MTTKIITSQNALDASSREGNEVNSVQILLSHSQSSFNYYFFTILLLPVPRDIVHTGFSEREKELQEQNLNKKETETPIKSTSHKLPCLVLLSQFVPADAASFPPLFKSPHNLPGDAGPEGALEVYSNNHHWGTLLQPSTSHATARDQHLHQVQTQDSNTKAQVPRQAGLNPAPRLYTPTEHTNTGCTGWRVVAQNTGEKDFKDSNTLGVLTSAFPVPSSSSWLVFQPSFPSASQACLSLEIPRACLLFATVIPFHRVHGAHTPQGEERCFWNILSFLWPFISGIHLFPIFIN